MATVSEIFERAEQCFEARVAQILQEKRVKAEETGAILNPRKAKRDARTAAGKEKSDGLVRRLADLALVQERVIALYCPDPDLVRKALNGAAGIFLSTAASSLLVADVDQDVPDAEERDSCRRSSSTNGNSGDGRSFSEAHEIPVSMFYATQSVVNYVLDSDFDAELTSYSPRSVVNTPVLHRGIRKAVCSTEGDYDVQVVLNSTKNGHMSDFIREK